MELTLKANSLYPETQKLEFDKIATLIGENGSGKSQILYSIYEDCIKTNSFPFHIVIGFSSGQNERFSQLNKKVKKNFNSDEAPSACYFYDRSWAKLIIFLASCLEKGHAKSFLTAHNYFDEWNKEVTLNFKFRVKKTYSDKVESATLQEQDGIFSELLQTTFHQKLLVFTEQFSTLKDYDFSYPIKPINIHLNSSFIDSPMETIDLCASQKELERLEQELESVTDIMDYIFDESIDTRKIELLNKIKKLDDYIPLKIKKQLQTKLKSSSNEDISEVERILGNVVKTAKDRANLKQERIRVISDQKIANILFFTEAALYDAFILKKSMTLNFGELPLEELSDGEYQLLFIYSLIDLFDSESTLFLFDEVDSHLHYKNVEKLWSLLHSIQGHAITTTHLLDSISAKENRIEHLKVVEQGRINEDNKIKQLISRLSVLSRAKSVEFEVCGKLPNIALLDDYNDWIIFTKLAARAGLDINHLTAVHAMKKSSSYATANETFGKGKIDWLHGLSKIESPLVTTQIFLICDRDEATLDWNAANGVQVNGQLYRELLNAIPWPRGTNVSPYLLAWKRREIKNYLLSHTALLHHDVLDQINNAELLRAPCYLQPNNPGDNDDLRGLNAKSVIDPLINTEGIGLDTDKLQAYIDLIPPDEISEDITNMYNFIIGKL